MCEESVVDISPTGHCHRDEDVIMATAPTTSEWRRPTLGDGSPVPVKADEGDNISVELRLSCRDLLGRRLEDVKCFCVVYSCEVGLETLMGWPTGAGIAGKNGASVSLRNDAGDVEIYVGPPEGSE